jgi:TRAP-type C4-dicarboxylate transport system permease large subunit
MVVNEATDNFSKYTMSVAPMFAIMGFVAYYSGLGSRLFTACQTFLGHLRGGLAMATAVACAFFGAICGSGRRRSVP